MPFDATTAEFVTFTSFLKAMPSEEAGKRFVYFEASNENRDYEGERVLAKALAESADYYLKFGNVDVDHITVVGARRGIPDYNYFEIGRPIEVKVNPPQTFVKAQLYTGESKAAEKANQVWESLTKLNPPARWYPSVSGAISERGVEIDPVTKESCAIIKKVRWTNVGLSRTPVNTTVGTVATIPMGGLMKCWGPSGLNLSKALEAGYGTDSATLEGGAALRSESDAPAVQSYWDFRDRLAGDIRAKRVNAGDQTAMVKHAASNFGVSHAEAAEHVTRFLADLQDGLSKQKDK